MAEAMAVNAATGLITEAAKAIVTAILSRTSSTNSLNFNRDIHMTIVETKLKTLRLLLLSCSNSNINNPLVDDWLNKVKNVAYDAEDLVDAFAFETLKRSLQRQNRLMSLLLHNPILFRFRMDHRMRCLIGAIDGIFKDAQELGIKPVEMVGPSTTEDYHMQQLQVQRELVVGRGLIGRDTDRENIVNMLRDPVNLNRDLSVFAIVGMAGLGKTALSRRVFDMNEVKEHFDERIWICVSHDFKVRGLLIKMIELVGGEISSTSSHQAMLQELEKKLRGKRYLLVLDDVWDTISYVWESLCGALLDLGGSKGTVVLATARSYQVAATMEVHVGDPGWTSTSTEIPLIYELKGLSYTDSWSLFMQRVHHHSIVEGSDLEAIARRMVIKSRGVPLALKALGDLLRSKSLEEWQAIEESEIWKLEDKNGILPSLMLSFNYLPSAEVKRCFAYCAIFPEDTIISREILIKHWMAHGFLHPCDKMEQIGNEYFSILLNSSFFQDVELDKKGNVTQCKMHDVVHALAKAVSKREYLTLTESIDMSEASSDTRHLFLLTEKEIAAELKHKLRTLMSKSLQIHSPYGLLTPAKCLRVLSLVDAGLKELPDSIGNMKYLRFLDLSGNPIMMFPNTITRLYNLQTFRHVYVRGKYWSEYPAYPRGLGKLVNLRHIHTDRFSCMGFSLRILLEKSSSAYKKWGTIISDLSSLDNLRGSLAIWQLEHVLNREEARKASLWTKAHIHQLDLTWSYNNNATSCLTNNEEVLEELQPHSNLKHLDIWYYKGQKSPSWLEKLNNLVQIRICYCRNLEQLPISPFLPSLKVLVMWGCDSLVSLTHVKDLKSLEKLKIGRCPMLKGLPNLTPLTNLKCLKIHNCAKMTTMPKGIASLPNLATLEVGPLCPDLDFFPFPIDLNGGSSVSESLRKLRLTGWPKVKNLPDQIQHFTRLQKLSMGYFDSLEILPHWIGSLISLEELELRHMFGLRYLPSQESLRRATRLLVLVMDKHDCPELKNKMDFVAMCHGNISRLQMSYLYSGPHHSE